MDNNEIRSMYLAGYSAREIQAALSLPITERSIQRRLKVMGVIRTNGDAMRLARKLGKVKYKTNPNKIKRKFLGDKLRYKILLRDGFRCVLCGTDAKETRIQVDHIDNDASNTIESNLQTLCEECNQGKMQIWLDSKK